jgi:hypothetical protein
MALGLEKENSLIGFAVVDKGKWEVMEEQNGRVVAVWSLFSCVSSLSSVSLDRRERKIEVRKWAGRSSVRVVRSIVSRHGGRSSQVDNNSTIIHHILVFI